MPFRVANGVLGAARLFFSADSSPEVCWASTLPTRLGDHGSPLEDGALPDSDLEAVGGGPGTAASARNVSNRANPSESGSELRSLLLNPVQILLGLGETNWTQESKRTPTGGTLATDRAAWRASCNVFNTAASGFGPRAAMAASRPLTFS